MPVKQSHRIATVDSPLTATGASLSTDEIIGDLWRRRLDTLIAGISNGDPYYQQIANAAEHVSAEYQGRFLIELIQNANDQAVRQGLSNSFVTIIRTATLIGVGNSGEPFDREKVDAITSIFKSDKTADECIGNKGIGFKAVFQVADSAEIYSSAVGSNLAEQSTIAFRIVRRPFEDSSFFHQIQLLAEELLSRHDDRRTAIESRFPSEDALNVTVREAKRAAWFTFPQPLSSNDYRTRIKELGLSKDLLAATQTLIVLPTDTSTQSDRVNKAIDEILGGEEAATNFPAAASLLFLPGIARVTVIDHVRGVRSELEKCDTSAPEDLEDGVVICRQRTILQHFDLAQSGSLQAKKSQDWWVAHRKLGSEDSGDSDRAAHERLQIREAIQALHLPEENWKNVEQIPITVAIPDPARGDSDEPKPIGADGRFCIGLPTLVKTGLPLWVSAHFHGKIDRTAIDFENDYNQLLFDAGLELVTVLLERLKRHESIAVRRLVTLMMERGDGELADAIYGEDGCAHSAVVLAPDGSFMKASDLRLPMDSDLPMFNQIIQGIDDLSAYGFVLPETALLSSARQVLDSLADSDQIEVTDAVYVRRPSGLPSLLEHAARHRRDGGSAFWEPFLNWLLDRLIEHHSKELETQKILPTGNADLSSSSMRVFFRPVRLAARSNEETPQVVDDAGDELASIDETIAPLLKFFDDTSIRVRTGTSRDYADLAQRLAPNVGGGLVRRPRQADLINYALIPALRASTGNDEQGLALLRQALTWLVGMPQKSKNTVAKDELLVPVCGQRDAWDWVEPNTAYLGEGWDTDPNINLITLAFGNRPRSQLIPWNRFEVKATQLFGRSDKRWWLERMKEIGVWDCPRIIRTDRRLQVAQSDSYSYLTALTWVKCPVPCPTDVWQTYVRRISKRRANTKSGQEFYLSEVYWIDGLEVDEIRPTIVEAMLRKPERYEPSIATHLSRWGGEDSTDVPSLWVDAFLTERWPVIPTSSGLLSPDKSWYLPLEIRSTKADRFTFLPCVKPEFSAARRLLSKIGVQTLEEASLPRLVVALHELSNRLTNAEPEDLRHIRALATDLYEAIQTRLKAGESPEGIKTLTNAPVPLIRNEKIVAGELMSIEQLFIDDDVIRRRYIRGFEDCYVIPKGIRQSYNEIVEALRDMLGAERVVRVSECEIDVQFEPFEQGTLLLDYIKANYRSQPVAEEIGLLIVNGGIQFTSPHEETFRQTWRQFTQTRVVRGELMGGSQRACFDAQHNGGPVLMVDSKLEPYQVIGEMWQLVGPTYRDIWTAYAQSLKAGETDQFFKDRGVSVNDRTEVEVAIGLGFEQRLRRYQPMCLSVWRRNNGRHSLDEFHDEWAKNARSMEMASTWLDWGDLQSQLELAIRQDEPDGSLSLLDGLGLSIGDWQKARRDLGQSPWRFVESERLYERARSALAGHMMAWYAYLVVPRAAGSTGPTLSVEMADVVHVWTERVRQLTVPDEVAEAKLNADEIISIAARGALQIGSGLTETQRERLLIEPLQSLAMQAPTEASAIRLKDEPDKSATIYERDEASVRIQHAVTTLDAVLKVASALAVKHGELLDEVSIRTDDLIVLLSQSEWANRVAVVAAVRYALERTCPKTASRMKERQSFRDFDDWRALWQKFEELGEIPKPAIPPPAPPKFDVLGSQWTQDHFDESAAEGPVGELARRLGVAIVPTLDLASLRDVVRNKVEQKVKRIRVGGGGGGPSKRVPDKYREMLGAVGEYFAYEQLKALCPDFDITNWRSKAKELFGYDQGNDGLGYDFEYTDSTGTLTGRIGAPHCLIEVKSAAGDGGESFEMTTNEWEVARRCHEHSENGIYVIIRVANVTSRPKLVDLLIDPIELHLQGVLDYSSRDLLVVLGQTS
jgi:hypothetical protein